MAGSLHRADPRACRLCRPGAGAARLRQVGGSNLHRGDRRDERGPRFVDRLALEATDINAAIDYAKARLPIDPKRIAMQGYSFGGIVTTLAAAGSTSLRAVVNQAPGALNWDKSPELQAALVAAAKKIRVPMACMAAENDATTESARVICATARAAGVPVEVKILPAVHAPHEPEPAGARPRALRPDRRRHLEAGPAGLPGEAHTLSRRCPPSTETSPRLGTKATKITKFTKTHQFGAHCSQRGSQLSPIVSFVIFVVFV